MTMLSSVEPTLLDALAIAQRAGFRTLAPFVGGPRLYSALPTDAHITDVRRGVMVDCETTGADIVRDEAVQLAIIPFHYLVTTGCILSVGEALVMLREPTVPVSVEAAAVHGLSAETLRGKVFDTPAMHRALGEAHLAIAHKASFDFPMLARTCGIDQSAVPWGCSYSDVPWRQRGFGSGSLGALLQDHTQHHFAGHDAAADCYATLHVLAQPFSDGSYPLAHVIRRVAEPRSVLFALHAAFGVKDRLSARGYRWNDPSKLGAAFPNQPKSWFLELADAELPAEAEWLDTRIYQWPGASRQALVVRVDPTRRFARA